MQANTKTQPKYNKLAMPVLIVLSFIVLNVGAASAIDWTNISTLIDGIGGIMPSITNLISAIVEPIIVLSVVGFLTGMLNGLLEGLNSALKFGR